MIEDQGRRPRRSVAGPSQRFDACSKVSLNPSPRQTAPPDTDPTGDVAPRAPEEQNLYLCRLKWPGGLESERLSFRSLQTISSFTGEGAAWPQSLRRPILLIRTTSGRSNITNRTSVGSRGLQNDTSFFCGYFAMRSVR